MKKSNTAEETLSVERLKHYAAKLKEYNYLTNKKQKITERLGTIHGIDYSRPRVTNGNSNYTSEEEHYIEALEHINSELAQIEKFIKPECKFIKDKIDQVNRWEYRKIIVLRYIDQLKWSEIIREFFEFEEDFEEEKEIKYKDKIFYWNRQAVAQLEKIAV